MQKTQHASEHSSDSSSKPSYHHGNLRLALVEAAIHVLEHDGVEHLSLRALARETGVSPAAPYSHFKDKADILAAVAELGFQKLALFMVERATSTKDARARLKEFIIAFLDFASGNKGMFNTMFDRQVGALKDHPTLGLTAGKSYSLIVNALLAQGQSREMSKTGALSLWSMMFGMAELLAQKKVTLEMAGVQDHTQLAENLLGFLKI